MSESSRFAKNYVAMVASFTINIGLNAATMLVLGWGLTVDGFGVFSYALAIVGILSIIGQAGTNQYSISFIPRNRHLIGEFLSAAQGLRIAALGPMLLAVLVLALVTCKTTVSMEVVMIMGLAMLLQLELLFIRDLLQAVEMNYLGSFLLMVRAGALLAGIGVWYAVFHSPWAIVHSNDGLDLLSLAIIWVVSHVPAVILAMRMVGKYVSPMTINWSPASWWGILRKSYLFGMVSLVMLSAGTIETFVLNFYKEATNEQIAYYQVALRLAVLTMLPSLSLMEVFRPIISRKYGESPEAFKRTVHLLHKFAFTTGAPLFLFCAVFASEILGLLFRGKYQPAVPLVQIICLANLLTVAPPLWMVFHMTDLQHLSFRIGVVNTVVNIALCLLLCPRFGMYGAAWVTAAVVVVSKIQTIIYWLRHRYPVCKSPLPLLGIMAVAALACGVCWLLRPYVNIVVLFVLFAAAMLAAHWVIAMEPPERAAAMGVIQRAKEKLRN